MIASPSVGELAPERGPADYARGVTTEESAEIQNLENSNSIPALAGVAADGDQVLEYLEMSPRPATELDTDAVRPRSKIRVLAVMGALFVSFKLLAPCSHFSIPLYKVPNKCP